jgi:hypothetical protein
MLRGRERIGHPLTQLSAYRKETYFCLGGLQVVLHQLHDVLQRPASYARAAGDRGQPQHGSTEVVVLGKIAIDCNIVDHIVADDRLNELITAMRDVGNPAP